MPRQDNNLRVLQHDIIHLIGAVQSLLRRYQQNSIRFSNYSVVIA